MPLKLSRDLNVNYPIGLIASPPFKKDIKVNLRVNFSDLCLGLSLLCKQGVFVMLMVM